MNEASVKIGQAMGKAFAAAGAAVIKLGKDIIQAYGDTEQLTGGIKKLYGNGGKSIEEYAKSVGKSVNAVKDEYAKLEKAQNLAIENANNAYKTTGMSANQYMQSVTSFSAAMINSVGGDTVKAAELSDQAMRDIADNANTFGTQTAEELAGVYTALAKGQFSTLDSLNLGYGGTQEGMYELMQRAAELDSSFAKTAKFSINSKGQLSAEFKDMAQAIHIVQQEMGITGTTANEAKTTIQGSINMTKASWTNLLAGMADDNADFDQLLDNFLESVGYVVDNILPRISVISDKIPEAVSKLASKIPGLVEQILPDLISAATNLLSGLVDALPGLFSSIVDILPMLLTALEDVTNSLLDALPDIIDTIINFISDPNNIEILVEAAITLFTALPLAISRAIPQILEAAPQIIMGILTGLKNAVPQLLSSFKEILKNLLDAFLSFFGIHSPSTVMKEKAKFIVDGIIESLKELPGKAAEWFVNMKDKIVEKIDEAKEKVKEKWEAIKNSISEAAENAVSAVKEKFENIKEAVSSKVEDAKTKASEGFEKIKTSISEKAESARDKAKTAFEDLKKSASDSWESMKKSAGDKFDEIRQKMSDPVQKAKDKIDEIVGKLKNMFNFTWKLPDIHLPHLKMSPGEAPYGIGGKGHLPTFDIKWYAKAYENPMMLNKPTIFGFNPTTGSFMGGGDKPNAGGEVISGAATLMSMIQNAVAAENGKLQYYLEKILELLATLISNLPEWLRNDLYLDGDKLVGGIAKRMNNKLGEISAISKRGVTV